MKEGPRHSWRSRAHDDTRGASTARGRPVRSSGPTASGCGNAPGFLNSLTSTEVGAVPWCTSPSRSGCSPPHLRWGLPHPRTRRGADRFSWTAQRSASGPRTILFTCAPGQRVDDGRTLSSSNAHLLSVRPSSTQRRPHAPRPVSSTSTSRSDTYHYRREHPDDQPQDNGPQCEVRARKHRAAIEREEPARRCLGRWTAATNFQVVHRYPDGSRRDEGHKSSHNDANDPPRPVFSRGSGVVLDRVHSSLIPRIGALTAVTPDGRIHPSRARDFLLPRGPATAAAATSSAPVTPTRSSDATPPRSGPEPSTMKIQSRNDWAAGIAREDHPCFCSPLWCPKEPSASDAG